MPRIDDARVRGGGDAPLGEGEAMRLLDRTRFMETPGRSLLALTPEGVG
jgi:hypothetical protein